MHQLLPAEQPALHRAHLNRAEHSPGAHKRLQLFSQRAFSDPLTPAKPCHATDGGSSSQVQPNTTPALTSASDSAPL